MGRLRESVREAYPLFRTPGGAESPTSARDLCFRAVDLDTAKELNRLWHSRFPEFGGGGARVCYAAEFDGIYYAVAIWTNPSSWKLPQRTWLMLKRWAIAPDAPRNTGSRMESWMRHELRRRFPEAETLVSYSDPDCHDGAIYKACNWQEGETTTRRPSQKWDNRERAGTAANLQCRRVTRWTKQLRKGGKP